MPVGIHTVDSEPRLYGNFFFFFLKQMPCYFQGLVYGHFQQCNMEVSGNASKLIYEESLVFLNWELTVHI